MSRRISPAARIASLRAFLLSGRSTPSVSGRSESILKKNFGISAYSSASRAPFAPIMRETEQSRTRLTKDCSLVAALLRALRASRRGAEGRSRPRRPAPARIVATELSGIDLPGARLAAI